MEILVPIDNGWHQFKKGEGGTTPSLVVKRRLTQTPPMSKRRALGAFSGAIVSHSETVLMFLEPQDEL